jgi:hypothetical protein
MIPKNRCRLTKAERVNERQVIAVQGAADAGLSRAYDGSALVSHLGLRHPTAT